MGRKMESTVPLTERRPEPHEQNLYIADFHYLLKSDEMPLSFQQMTLAFGVHSSKCVSFPLQTFDTVSTGT